MASQANRANIILTGFMGTGKTTTGKLIASQLDYNFVDTDDLIEERAERTIPQIFAELGEEAFRQMENDIAVELAEKRGFVIATGGRMMLDSANAEALGATGQVICLVATPEEILARIAQDDTGIPRPLLSGPDPADRVRQLFQEREAAYQRFYQITTTGKAPTDVAAEVIHFLNAKIS
ncbi:MAG: shikimate kinase [Chloroflexota bacterium]